MSFLNSKKTCFSFSTLLKRLKGPTLLPRFLNVLMVTPSFLQAKTASGPSQFLFLRDYQSLFLWKMDDLLPILLLFFCGVNMRTFLITNLLNSCDLIPCGTYGLSLFVRILQIVSISCYRKELGLCIIWFIVGIGILRFKIF